MPLLTANPASEEITARYISESNRFSKQNSRVKHRAFHPARDDHKTSIFRISELSEEQIWYLGDTFVASEINRELLARAELTVAEITSLGLRVQPDEPPIRHANIDDWPLAKEKWLSLAQELAARATLKVRQ